MNSRGSFEITRQIPDLISRSKFGGPYKIENINSLRLKYYFKNSGGGGGGGGDNRLCLSKKKPLRKDSAVERIAVEEERGIKGYYKYRRGLSLN